MPIELWTARMERPLSDPEREAILPLMPPARRERLLRMKEAHRQRPVSYTKLPLPTICSV